MDTLDLYHEDRPWGEFLQFIKNTPATVKIITVKKGQAFSLQTHEHRVEHWYALSGTGVIEIGNNTFPVTPGTLYDIPRETTHRITATDADVVVLEIATGAFDENDIKRIEDRYGRAA